MRVTLLLALLTLPLTTSAAPEKPLIVHEWGTFTSLQDEQGRTVGGVNIDDEPLPKFVHRLGERKGGEAANPWVETFLSKSLYPGHRSVTMRLETPVIYFYPPDNKPITLDVTATFNGGVLSEYFPDGATTLDGKPYNRSPESLNAKMRGGITWKNVTVNTPTTQPHTDAHVWLAPRNVAAAPISVGAEGERYIFYRGAGHFDAPLRVLRSGDGKAISIYENNPFEKARAPLKLRGVWLADFRGDGSCAFRSIEDAPAHAASKAIAHDATFADAEYSTENVVKLRDMMKRALIADGLFADEAEAMLETWKLSYFQSAGQRLFFIVPKAWTNQVLPLKFSVPAEVTRVMVGRIELVTPQQRLVLDRLSDQTVKLDEATTKELTRSLGRFGAPLVNDAERQRAAQVSQAAAAQ